MTKKGLKRPPSKALRVVRLSKISAQRSSKLV